MCACVFLYSVCSLFSSQYSVVFCACDCSSYKSMTMSPKTLLKVPLTANGRRGFVQCTYMYST